MLIAGASSLQAADVLQHGRNVEVGPGEQVLSTEDRPVDLTLGQRRSVAGHACILAAELATGSGVEGAVEDECDCDAEHSPRGRLECSLERGQ